MARAGCGCAAPAAACAARRWTAACRCWTVQSKPTLQLHNPCHQRRVRGQQCRNGFLLRGILNLQTRNDLLRHFGSAGSLSVIITRRRFQSRCHEQVNSCHESRVKRFLLPHTWVVTLFEVIPISRLRWTDLSADPGAGYAYRWISVRYRMTAPDGPSHSGTK